MAPIMVMRGMTELSEEELWKMSHSQCWKEMALKALKQEQESRGINDDIQSPYTILLIHYG